jgi:hypothetical protein
MVMANVVVPVDPRVFPDPCAAAPEDIRLYALATDSLAAPSRQHSDALDREVRGELELRLTAESASLATLFASAPSVAVTRYLWRHLDAVWQEGRTMGDAGLALVVFAMPIVVVGGSEGAASDIVHSGVLRDPELLAAILRKHGALQGGRNFALSNTLMGVDAIDLLHLPEIFAWQRLADSEAAGFSPRATAPSPFSVPAGRESVHLRFIVGSMLARQGLNMFRDPNVASWGASFTKELSRQLAGEGVLALALARAPERPLPAVRTGRVAQREVAAQIFASNAIRRLRASVGEPVAVISAHRAPDAPGGGELRLSLSSPFSPHDAEGFRCPLYALDSVGDVGQMLASLMADCRVTDVRIAAGIHGDRDPTTGLTLLFKPDTLPDANAMQ